MHRVHSLWVCFTPDGVIQNGYIFKSRTHTSGHFDIGVTPSPRAPTPPPIMCAASAPVTLTQYHQSILTPVASCGTGVVPDVPG